MKGLSLAEAYYNEYGRQMLETEFSEYIDRIAVGLVGEGSECLGFDDEFSSDHDFEPGFCLFITAEDERRFGFKLERAYARLPKEFCGYKRERLSPVGGARHGVIVIEEFYRKLLGLDGVPKTAEEWLSVPPHRLLAASNGKVFRDELGAFSEVRSKLINGYPQPVRLIKIAEHLQNAAQSGQYNYERCMRRGETGGACLALYEFVKNTVSLIYLINNRYEPFYKWAFRGMRELPLLSETEAELLSLLEKENTDINLAEKLEIIEAVAGKISEALRKEGISTAKGSTLLSHMCSVNDTLFRKRF